MAKARQLGHDPSLSHYYLNLFYLFCAADDDGHDNGRRRLAKTSFSDRSSALDSPLATKHKTIQHRKTLDDISQGHETQELKTKTEVNVKCDLASVLSIFIICYHFTAKKLRT